MNITVQVEPASDTPAAVEYRWDTDTAILTASVADAPARTDGVSGSVELAGSDGSWVILDVRGGSVRGVEVAVWPDVRKLPALAAPADAEVGRIRLPAGSTTSGVAVMQMDTTLVAEADPTERTIHFQLGTWRPSRTVCIARDILVDVDDHHGIKGIWLLNVPPFPGDE
ncbi:MAG TPA: hypothetical protein VF041_18565 [Gemmatimonadaceae bacterium]